jgi:hypothetical protein
MLFDSHIDANLLVQKMQARPAGEGCVLCAWLCGVGNGPGAEHAQARRVLLPRGALTRPRRPPASRCDPGQTPVKPRSNTRPPQESVSILDAGRVTPKMFSYQIRAKCLRNPQTIVLPEARRRFCVRFQR